MEYTGRSKNVWVDTLIKELCETDVEQGTRSYYLDYLLQKTRTKDIKATERRRRRLDYMKARRSDLVNNTDVPRDMGGDENMEE